MNKIEIRKLTIHGMMYQALYWFDYCTYAAFLITTLIDHGWSVGVAASLITAMSVIVLVMQPVYGHISDNYISEKTLSVILLSLTVIFLSLLPFSLRSGKSLLVIINMIGITATAAQIGGLIDAWIVGLKQEYETLNYGLIRGMGSFAYALSAQIMGMLTVALGHSIRIWIGSGAFLIGRRGSIPRCLAAVRF